MDKVKDEVSKRVIVLKFREAFDKRGLTQKAVSEMTGIRPNAISALARGYVDRLTLDHVERIAVALDIDDLTELVDLVEREDAE